MRIAYLVDTSFIVPKNCDESFLNDIYYLPFIVTDFKGVEHKTTDSEWNDKTLISMLMKQPKVGLKTSMTPIGILEAKVLELLKSYDYVIGMPIAEKLSSQWNSFAVLEKRDEFKDKFFCIGEDNLPFSSFYILKFFNEFFKSKEGIATKDIEDVKDAIKKNLSYTTLVFVGDLSRLIIGGRLNPAVGAIGKAVGLKIALEYDLESGLKKLAIQRSIMKLIDESVKLTIKSKSMNISNLKAQLFEFGTSQDLKKEIYNLLSEQINVSNEFMKIPSIMSAHIGMSSFAITLIDDKSQKQEV